MTNLWMETGNEKYEKSTLTKPFLHPAKWNSTYVRLNESGSKNVKNSLSKDLDNVKC